MGFYNKIIIVYSHLLVFYILFGNDMSSSLEDSTYISVYTPEVITKLQSKISKVYIKTYQNRKI